MQLSRSGIALVTIMIFVILISIVAIASIHLIAGQALLIEHRIQRTRAYYVAEAALQLNLMCLLAGLTIQPNLTIDSLTANVTQPVGSGPLNTSILEVRVEYH